MNWPDGARFAFSIVDDTEGASLIQSQAVYDLLDELGLRTTKTVWVYPPRDGWHGLSLVDDDYRRLVLDLQGRGFEIALHGVGSGSFTRDEIIEGLDEFKRTLGTFPKMHINHHRNPDNIYWGTDRFTHPVAGLMNLLFREKRQFFGSREDSPYYWGDICRDRIRFMRNHVFKDIVTSNYDRHMPYRVQHKSSCSNYWFSSSDGHSAREFIRLTRPENVDRLVSSGGYCIIYTHFAAGFVGRNGRLNREFEANMRYLASQPGWFAPASSILEYRLACHGAGHTLTPAQLRDLDMRWLVDRVSKAVDRYQYKRLKTRERKVLSGTPVRPEKAAGQLQIQ